MPDIALDINVGFSGNDPATENVANVHAIGGWPLFIKQLVAPAYQAGCRLIFLHNPFGAERGVPMRFDQALRARKLKLWWLTRGYVKTWKQAARSLPGLEVVAYLGKLRGDPEFVAYLRAGRVDQWWWRWWQSTRLPLAAGQAIAFDAMGNADPVVDYPEIQAVNAMDSLVYRTKGKRCYVESSVPADSSSALQMMPQWVAWGTYRRRHVSHMLHPAETGKYPTWNVDGERNNNQDLPYGKLYVFFRTSEFTEDRVRQVWRNGHCVVLRTLEQWDKARELDK